jgi:hypothetical protein
MFVKGFFENFSKNFFVGVSPPSLDFSYSIAQPNGKVKGFFEKNSNFGKKIFFKNFQKKS